MSARILVVDDDAAIRLALADALGDGSSAEIDVASSAEEALRMVDAKAPPDVVLTDLRMRGLDGMDLLHALRQRAPSSRVVLMTAYHDVGTAVNAMRDGASDFLCKPFDLSAVRSVLGRLLEPEYRPPATGYASGGGFVANAGAVDRAPARDPLAGRYTIEAEVGHGAMATVFRARDVRHDRHVAIKVLRREIATSVGTERFLREIRITARLHHPHILTLIDSGEWDGAPYFVMPLVKGDSLRHRLTAGGRMAVAEAAKLLCDVADALAAAHALGIVHRDVKPENILLSGHHAWVADFGVARALWEAVDADSTLAGAVVGTPAYMAPEQASGDREAGHLVDVYALGVVAYELLAGSTPFPRESTRAILTAHVSAVPPPLRESGADVPAPLEEAVMRCLAKEPGDRWPSAQALSEAFGRFAI